MTGAIEITDRTVKVKVRRGTGRIIVTEQAEPDPGTLAPHAYGRKYGSIKPHNLAVAIAACLPRSDTHA